MTRPHSVSLLCYCKIDFLSHQADEPEKEDSKHA